MTPGPANYRYFNLNGRWPGFQPWRLESSDDGTWKLATLPGLDQSLPAGIDEQSFSPRQAGVAVLPDGSIYYTDSEAHMLRVLDDCGENGRVAVGGKGDQPGRFNSPRDVAWHPLRKALLVCDTDNHRIQLFSAPDMQLLGVWPCAFPPGSMAVDAAGAVYVVDTRVRRLRKLNIHGESIAFDLRVKVTIRILGYWTTVMVPVAASGVAIDEESDSRRVYVLDADKQRIVVCNTDGEDARTAAIPDVLHPQGFVVTPTGILVGDTANGLLRRYIVARDDVGNLLTNDAGALVAELIGDAPDYEGPIAGLGFFENILWLHPGGSLRPIRMRIDGAHGERGLLWSQPFNIGASPVLWQRLRALCEQLSDDARVRLYVFTSENDNAPPPPRPRNAGPPAGPNNDLILPAGEGEWQKFNPGDDALIQKSSRYLSLAVELEGDGHHSPLLEQLRVDFDHPSLSRYLPEIYRTQTSDVDTLERFLALFESFYDDVESVHDELTGWLDPHGIPEMWLDWLGEWLAVEIEDEWSPERKRAAIQSALRRYNWRGTVAGLREALRVQAGVEAHIIEPLLLSSWWQLQESSNEPASPRGGLGLTTRLATAEPQGAVLGTSAIADHSHLLRQEEYGLPLFESTAFRFTVYIRRTRGLDEEKLAEICRVVEREKPAHTTYELCVIEPTLRIGVQSVIGVDTLIGGEPPRPSPLGSGSLDNDLVLGSVSRFRIGQNRIGEIRLQ